MKNKTTWLILGLILIAAVSRLIPHLPNFTPIGAIALFAGSCLTSVRLGILVPLAALLFSDILLEITAGIGFHDQMIWTYGSVGLIALMGSKWLKNGLKTTRLLTGALGSSILFFLVTNFGVWTGGYYGLDISGLISCYVAGIPFFHYTLMGDVVYSLVLFKGFYAVAKGLNISIQTQNG